MRYTDEDFTELGRLVYEFSEALAKNAMPSGHAVIPVRLANKMISYIEIKKPAWHEENYLRFWDITDHGEFESGF